VWWYTDFTGEDLLSRGETGSQAIPRPAHAFLKVGKGLKKATFTGKL